ncbi:IS66 family insertion sequence element accessory protein TnpA [Colwellia sp. BRX10-4]|uniref:IS66 family insertion sequence element accessory protein TnpA n=1 Tax=Colwellia sp. BRX10-4 TaxID=2759843 RepID=UPI00385583C0
MNKQQKIKHWYNIFEHQQRSDFTIIQFCRDNNINVSTFYGWRNPKLDIDSYYLGTSKLS